MARFIIRRLLQMIPLLVGITFLIFALINLVPGSPIQAFEDNPRARPEDIQRIRENLGLDEPWPVRYFIWLGDAFRGNLGYSLLNGTAVADRITAILPNTLLLDPATGRVAVLPQPVWRTWKRPGSAGSRSTTWTGAHAHCHTLMPGVRENRISPRVPSTATRGQDSAMRARSNP